MKPLLLSLLFLSTAAVAFGDVSADRNEVVAVASSFYDSYAGGDLAGALALWSPQAKAIDPFRRRATRLLRTHCFQIGSWNARAINVSDDVATVEVEAEWLDTNNMPGSVPFVDFGDGTLTLHREEGRWRIADWARSTVHFGDVLAEGDEAARAAVLANPRIRCRSAMRELAQRAVTLLNQRKFDASSRLIAAAERISYEIGDDTSLAVAYASHSILRRYDQVDRVASLDLAERAMELAERDGDADAILRTLTARGGVNHAEDYVPRAFALRDYVADPALIAVAATRVARMYDDRGDHWSSLQYTAFTMRYAEESGDLSALIAAEVNTAQTYWIYNDVPLYMLHLRRAVELCRQAGFYGLAADAMLDEAHMEIDLGHRKRAKELIDEAAKEPSREGEVLVLRGLYRQDPAGSDRYLTQAIQWGDTHQDDAVLMEALRIMIRKHLDRGEPVSALPYAKRLKIAHGTGPAAKTVFEDAALTAEAERRAGRTAEALRDINDAIETSERERIRILGDDRQQRAFSSGRLKIYGELVTIRVDAGETFPALIAADEAKGRTLLDILRSKRSTFDDVMTAEERAQELELRGRAAALRREYEAAPEQSRAALAKQLAASRTEVESFQAGVAMKYPHAVPTWAPPPPMTESTLRKLLADPSLAIVEFMVTGDRLHAFVVRSNARGRISVHATTKAIRNEVLRRRIGRFVATLSRADVDYRAEAKRLYRLLLAPLSPQLDGARIVCIVPDGPLWQLPFEALIAPDGRFFVEHTAPFYVPSIAVYALMRGEEPRNQRGTLFALANPIAGMPERGAVSRLRAGEKSPLPDATREVRTAARILGGRSAVYVGASASKERLEEEASGYRILHFATHGVLDDTDPMYSHLVLAPSAAGDDGVLETWQMMRMKFDAELAVLAACDTARGPYHEGEGVVGMSWAFFVAGCPSTISTQWKIASAPTADLLIDFYRQWNAVRDQPLSKALALAKAQRQMLRHQKRRHPFYWAPFILVGVG